MSGAAQMALAAGPLAVYLAILAAWHSGRRPTVVAGPIDFALLTLGVGGLLTFGPFGHIVARAIFGRPNLLDWLTLISGEGLIATLLARRSLRRLAVYAVDPEVLDRSLRDILARSPGRFAPTLGGFEDRAGGRGLAVDASPRLRAAHIEAYGKDPEILIQELAPRLDERLRAEGPSPSRLARPLALLSVLSILAFCIGCYLARPQAVAALRALMQRFQGGL